MKHDGVNRLRPDTAVVDMREVDLLILIRDGAAEVQGRVKGKRAAVWLRHLADQLESDHNDPEVA